MQDKKLLKATRVMRLVKLLKVRSRKIKRMTFKKWQIKKNPRALQLEMKDESVLPFESIIETTPLWSELPIQKRLQLSRVYELGLNKLVPMLEKKKFIFMLDSWLELKGMDEGSEDGQIPFDNSFNDMQLK